jgi:hypothetical protein
MMSTTRAGLGLLLLLSGACASNTSNEAGPAPVEDSRAGRDAIEVQVDNQNLSDMNVYLVKGGSRWLVGQASGLKKSTLTIPGSSVSADARVRLVADPIGGARTIATPTLVVPQGQRIYWTIGSDLSMSNASAGE